MMNDFSTIDAQDEVSRSAQMTPDEMAEANTYYDTLAAEQDAEEEIFPITPEGLAMHERSWQMWRDVHAELENSPKVAALRQRQAIMDRV